MLSGREMSKYVMQSAVLLLVNLHLVQFAVFYNDKIRSDCGIFILSCGAVSYLLFIEYCLGIWIVVKLIVWIWLFYVMDKSTVCGWPVILIEGHQIKNIDATQIVNASHTVQRAAKLLEVRRW